MKKYQVLVMVGQQDCYHEVICKEEEIRIVASALWRAADRKHRNRGVACVVSEEGNPCDRKHFDMLIADCM